MTLRCLTIYSFHEVVVNVDEFISGFQHDARTLFDWFEIGMSSEPFSETVYESLKALWMDPGVQNCFHLRETFQLFDSAE